MTNYQGLFSTTVKARIVSYWRLPHLSVNWRGLPVSFGVALDGLFTQP